MTAATQLLGRPAPLLVLTILGTPGTAGSKDGRAIFTGKGEDRKFTGKVAVTESPSPVKKTWRQAVMDEAAASIGCQCPEPGCKALRPGWPLDEPLLVAMAFTVTRPKSARPGAYPSGRPDVLKYGRATEDHMKDAGVYVDDARIVEYGRLVKCYPGEDPDALDVPGALVVIWSRRQLPAWNPQRHGLPRAAAISTREPRPRQDVLF